MRPIQSTTIILTGLLLLQFFVYPLQTYAQEKNNRTEKITNLLEAGEYNSQKLVVKYKNRERVDDSSLLSITNSNKFVQKGDVEILKKEADKEYSKEEIEKILDFYLSKPEVEYAEPAYLYSHSWLSVDSGVMPNEYDSNKHETLITAGFHRLMDELGCNTGSPHAACGGTSDLTLAVLDSGISLESFTWSGGQNDFGTVYGEPSEFSVSDASNNTSEMYDESDSDSNGFEDDIHGVDLETWYDCTDSSYGFFRTTSGTYPCLGEDVTKIGRPYDDNGHGTFIASQLGSDIENSEDMIGMVYETPIMAVDIFYYLGGDYDDFFTDSINIYNGILYSVDNGADVLNLSFGSSAASSLTRDAVNYAESNEVVLIGASGNQDGSASSRPVNYPAAYSTVLSVGAASEDGSGVASYSSYGTASNENALYVDLVAATGFNAYAESLTCFFNSNCSTTYSGSSYDSFSKGYSAGTSFAAPQVAAGAIYVKALNPSYSAKQIRSVLTQATIDILAPGPDAQSGAGLFQFDLLNNVTPIEQSQVARFIKLPDVTHFYTSSSSERIKVENTLSEFYQFEYINYEVFNSEAPLTVPVYRFFNLIRGTHFYTIKKDERDKVINLYPHIFKYEGVKFYVYKEPKPGAIPVYRFLNLNYGDVHFYTARESEYIKVITQFPNIFYFEGIAFYVEPT